MRAIIADTGDPRVTVKIEGGWSRPLFPETASKALYALAEACAKEIDAPVVRRILEHLGLWQPEAMERSPPLPPEAWPANSLLPITCHLPPDSMLQARRWAMQTTSVSTGRSGRR